MSEHVSTERMNESLDGLLSDADTTPIERHLDTCASCRNEYARLFETIKAVASLPRQARASRAGTLDRSRDRACGRGRPGNRLRVPTCRRPCNYSQVALVYYVTQHRSFNESPRTDGG